MTMIVQTFKSILHFKRTFLSAELKVLCQLQFSQQVLFTRDADEECPCSQKRLAERQSLWRVRWQARPADLSMHLHTGFLCRQGEGRLYLHSCCPEAHGKDSDFEPTLIYI
jgi:hypothetical protein